MKLPTCWTIKAESLGLALSLCFFSLPTAAYVVFQRTVIDPIQVRNGHKPKAIGDVNGDGLKDVFAYTAGKGLHWYAAPTWTKHKIHGSFPGEQAQAVDVDNDGDVDIVVGGIGLSARWYANPLKQGSNPATVLWAERTIGGATSHDLETGDINRDGKVDVFTQDALFLQNNPASWSKVDNSRFPGRAGQGTSLGDIDRDGDLDLLDASAGKLVWYENPRPAASPAAVIWTKRVIGPAFYQTSIRTADLNADGRLDVLLSNAYGTGGLQWFKGPPDPRAGTWTARTIDASVSFVHQSSIMVGDVDGDGTRDVAIAEQEQSHDTGSSYTFNNDRIAVYYNTARDGSTWSRQVLASTGGHNPKMGDIDNDGDLDILNANHGYYGAPNPIELWRNRN